MIFITEDSYLKRTNDRRYEIRSTFSKDGSWHFIDFEGRRIGESNSMERAEAICREHAHEH